MTNVTNTVSVWDPFNFFNNSYYYTTGGTGSSVSYVSSDSYPPYNVREIDEDTRVFELAVAGFKKDEIKVTLENRVLSISGEKDKEEEETKYLHKGIGTRKFSKTVTLWEYWEVESADMNDGILYIVIKREIPEEKKPRSIKIK
jgi:molecular chaperone IbpA